MSTLVEREQTSTEDEKPNRRDRRRSFVQRWRATALPNKAMVIATIIIAASNALYTVYARRTLEEIRSGSSDTKTLAQSAKAQADALSDQYKEMVAARKQTDLLIEKATAQAQNTNDLARAAARSAAASEASLKVGRDSLQFSETSIALQERAWIGVDDIRLKEPIQSGKAVKVVYSFHNPGRTPAGDVVLRSGWALNQSPQRFFEPSFEMVPVVGKSIVLPGEKFESGELKTFTLNAIETQKLQNSLITLYVFGNITYKDVFGKERMTKFCASYSPGENTFLKCPYHNEAI